MPDSEPPPDPVPERTYAPSAVPTSFLTASARRGRGDETKAGEAYRAIKDMIVSLELEPASIVDEEALAQRLGLGLTPVRQALRRLAWENLVLILPRRGTIVADLNASDLEKIFEMRVELEGLAAELAARRATPADRAAIADVARRTGDALAADPIDYRNLIELDREMHRLLFRSAHNELLEQTLEWLYSHVMRLWNVSLHRVGELPAAVADHLPIAAAVEAGDAATARRLMRAHVSHFQEAFSRA
jgi:DNA-binding GntR family transcriptional regulator